MGAKESERREREREREYKVTLLIFKKGNWGSNQL